MSARGGNDPLKPGTANHDMSTFEDQLNAALGPLAYPSITSKKKYSATNYTFVATSSSLPVASAPCYSTEYWSESDLSTEDIPRFYVMAPGLKDFDIKGFARRIVDGEKELFCDFISDATGDVLRFFVNKTNVSPVDKGKIRSWDLIGHLKDGRLCYLSIIN